MCPEVVVVARTHLPNLHTIVGKLYAELNDFDEALRLLEAKLDDGIQTPSAMELYYGVLARRKELKSRLNAALKEVLLHAKHRRSDVLAEIAAYV
jgi:hypothetical protein